MSDLGWFGMVNWCFGVVWGVLGWFGVIPRTPMRFHFSSLSYMSTLHVDLNLSRF